MKTKDIQELYQIKLHSMDVMMPKDSDHCHDVKRF